MCCIISSDPVEDPTGRLRTFQTSIKFQTNMLDAPFKDCPSTGCWFCGQFLPVFGGCTQYALRSKALEGDLTKYTCCQGYFDSFCFKAGSCGEQACPELCLFAEACCCNCYAVSATRIYVMEKYDLSSDPCDFRLIRINNCLQILKCVCDIAAAIDPNLRNCADFIDRVADLFYHCVSGCMTAQVAYELNYQQSGASKALINAEVAQAVPYTASRPFGEQMK